MKRALFVLILLCAAGLTQGLAAEPPMELTVDQAIQLALTNNPAHQASQQEVRQYRYRLMQAFGFLP